MLKNFFLLTFRNFIKNKFFVIVNVLGLGIALACCIVAYYNVRFHYDYNAFHENRDDIYKISLNREVNGRQQAYGFSPLSLAPAIGNSISGIENMTRLTRSKMPVRYNENIFSERISFVDTTFLDIFDFNVISGNPNSLKVKGNILVSQKFATNCFGDQNPIGKFLKIYTDEGVERSFLVSGIFENIPENSSMRFDLLCDIDNFIEMHEIEEHSWKNWIAATFLWIPEKDKVESINNQLERFVAQQNDMRKDWPVTRFYLAPLSEIPTSEREIWENYLNSGLHPAAFIAPPIMAILLLLLACLNFTNTSLAISSGRLKEIGLRKVFGGVGRQTMFQFLGENMILCLMALLVSLIIGSWLIDAYSDMWPYMTLKMNFTDGLEIWFFLLALLLVTGVVAGSYPAFYVSRFNPIKILKGDIKFSSGGLFSKILLVFQFILAIAGITAGVIFTQNAYFQDTLYLGYEKDELITVPVRDNAKLEAFKSKALQNTLVKNVGISEEHLGWGSYSRTIKWGEEKEHEITCFDIGEGYFETMGFTLIAGRHFDQEFKDSERGKVIIVNEKFVEDYGWDAETALGQRVREKDTIDLTIVGVVENFYPWGFWAKVNPALFKLGVKERMRMLVVRADVDDLKHVNDYMRDEWESLIPNLVYPGFFQEETLAEAKEINKQIKITFLFLAIVAVILSLVGLYTLVSLNIIKKTKEIGIRKVLGASVLQLTKLINRDFIVILIISSVFGSALGYYLSEMLLSSIWTVYLDTSLWSFIIPVAIILLVSMLTLSGKVYQAAARNPVDSIKYE